jgi:hypothetical protein
MAITTGIPVGASPIGGASTLDDLTITGADTKVGGGTTIAEVATVGMAIAGADGMETVGIGMGDRGAR